LSDISQSSELNVHDTLINLVNDIKETDVAISLSSGIDSASVLFALLECGKKVTAYSFTLDTHKSRDFTEAEMLANKLGLDFVAVILPTDVDTLITDCFNLHNLYGCRKKTDYICTWPFLYLTPKVSENTLATGMAADGHFVISKKGCLHYKDNPTEFRKAYFSNPTRCQLPCRTKLANECGVKLFEPYLSNEMYEYLLNTTWNECNKPQQKMPIRRAFPDMYSKYMTIHQHTNFQLGDSGISSHFDILLNTRLNVHNYKSVTGIFSAINRGEFNGPSQSFLF
jgi:asparagine synthetase B (glutamine-hydrolysing)